MPGFDGTGPRGMGPMTGGGRGFCNPSASVYNTSFRGAGRGGIPWGGGRGRAFVGGRGFRARGANWAAGAPGYFYGNPASQTEAETLQKQFEYLEAELQSVKARLDELKRTE